MSLKQQSTSICLPFCLTWIQVAVAYTIDIRDISTRDWKLRAPPIEC